MKIGLTGSRGVLGSRIADALRGRGYELVTFAGDVRDATALARWAEGLDGAIHAAAIVPLVRVVRDPAEAVAVNVGGTINVARSISTRPLIYISTAHVYASSDRPLREDAQIDPSSLYGLTKLQGEEWVRRLSPAHLILRLFSYFDARQGGSFLVPALRERIRTASPDAQLELAGAESVRDLADAMWLATVCVELLESRARGVVNVGAGKGRTVTQIAKAVARRLNRSDVRWVPQPGVGARMLVADTAYLRNLLPAIPPFSFDMALDRFCAETQS